ncbi:Holliday junction resolvase RuvX [Caloramator proteoclasticus]|uniref:Putative pre-16S rRNA nuclease n=1 Tax=Caloramator proteoclasticus DSM 10124 TaxID=1121262 RepID=A0A1M4VDK3_9CLOT|nr:Holliday junction resolvase RuvX [Caloramator proteoclasticus]SHE66958.1 putative holliday junction resolvase [Caloramator proteoclasticus DSM 10124]
MRILGLDVGDKTIGVAVSDPLGWTAQGVKTIKRIGIKKDLQEILNIIKEYNIEKIVVGLPKNMNGTLGPQSEKVLNFCDKLKEVCNLEIILEDERLTTVAAERMLIEADMHWSKRKKVIDTIAATYILQGYLDKIKK